jgi:hypothetical protein
MKRGKGTFDAGFMVYCMDKAPAALLNLSAGDRQRLRDAVL